MYQASLIPSLGLPIHPSSGGGGGGGGGGGEPGSEAIIKHIKNLVYFLSTHLFSIILCTYRQCKYISGESQQVINIYTPHSLITENNRIYYS